MTTPGPVSGLSSLVIELGSESFMITRSTWPYCRCSGPVVYGMSYFSHSAADLGRDLGVPVARQVREQVVLDLVAEVAAHHVEQRAALEVGGAEDLSQVPLRRVSSSSSSSVKWRAPSGK